MPRRIMETLTSYQADCLSVISPSYVGALMPAARFRDFEITSARMTIRDCLRVPPSSCSPPTIPRRALIAISQPWVVPVRSGLNHKASRKLCSLFFVWIRMYWHPLSFSCMKDYYPHICIFAKRTLAKSRASEHNSLMISTNYFPMWQLGL